MAVTPELTHQIPFGIVEARYKASTSSEGVNESIPRPSIRRFDVLFFEWPTQGKFTDLQGVRGHSKCLCGLLELLGASVEALLLAQPLNAIPSERMRIRLCASACHSNTAPALTLPQTLNRLRPRRRSCALTHSMLAARRWYSAWPS